MNAPLFSLFPLGKNELMLGCFLRILSGSEPWELRIILSRGAWNSSHQDFLMEVDEAPEAACKRG